MISPETLGAPKRFSAWRPQQVQALDWLVSHTKRFSEANLPVGTGKSLIAWAYPKLLGARAVILTETRGLQDQYERDLREAGLYDIRGMQNYPCHALVDLEKCDAGPCLDGEACVWRNAGCAYFDREKEAANAQIIVTNYAYWYAHESGVLGPRDVLICDEAHSLSDSITRAAGCSFTRHELSFPEQSSGLADWIEWGKANHERFLPLLDPESSLSRRQRKEVRALVKRLARLAGADADTWGIEYTSRPEGVRFEPLLPTKYAESILFRGLPRVVLLSGTLRPGAIEELGVARGDYAAIEMDSPFPVARRPIYWLETGVRVTGETSQTNLEFWAGKIDQVMTPRLRWKGVLHTVSYDRARFLKKHSRFAQHMYLHSPETTREEVERFRNAAPPAILVSPSVHTGWDFPYEQARWQVIAKVPFPDTRTGIAAARKEAVEHYIQKQAAVKLNQMYGRIVRAEDDLGETIIVDDSMKWLYSHFRPYFTKMFREAFQPVLVVPAPRIE